MLKICLLLIALWSERATADWKFRHHIEISPQYRQLNQEGFSPNDEIFDVFGMFNSHIEWSGKKWFVEVKPEIRSVASRGAMDPLPDFVTSQTTKRFLRSRVRLADEEDGDAYLDFDRFNIRHTFEGGEVFLGRKPLSLGVLRFFPVWNKLNLPIVFQPGPEWVLNPDVVGGSFQHGRFSYRAFHSRTDRPQVDDISLGEVRFFGTGVEWQILAGQWWEHTAAGVAGAFDAFGSTLRFESLWFSRQRDEPSQVQVGLGAERAISEKWTLVTEGLYQSAGLVDLQNTPAVSNRFMILGGRYYFFPYFIYQMNTLWTLHMGALAGFSRKTSYVAVGGFERSLGDNTSLLLKIKWPVGDADGEFGDKRVLDPLTGAHMGASSVALLQLQMTF